MSVAEEYKKEFEKDRKELEATILDAIQKFEAKHGMFLSHTSSEREAPTQEHASKRVAPKMVGFRCEFTR